MQDMNMMSKTRQQKIHDAAVHQSTKHMIFKKARALNNKIFVTSDFGKGSVLLTRSPTPASQNQQEYQIQIQIHTQLRRHCTMQLY